ncbi:hypothetical protein BN1723_012797 [Verticillium longisporum]|uniref:Proteasome alpha-type subunits domain-containing protein n=1 Tax=Verticillium longisporum TaxID=100787 RepID=A0A0G4LLM9_VERLO|nr:hypothetical protein BN1723_012797 [Verticillium longisporum]
MQEVVGGLRTDTDGDKDIGRCARLRLASRNEVGTRATHCVLDDIGDEGGHDERDTKAETTIFSPEGRLYQVEYALEAISHAGTAIGILAQDGIVLAAERKVTSKLLEQDTSAEKLYTVNDNMICAVAGMTADANILINYARQAAQRYLLTYNEDIPCEQLVRRLCDLI